MKDTKNIRRTEEYTENTEVCYRLFNITTREKLIMKVSAGDGAVLRHGDRVLVTDCGWRGYIAGVYEYLETPEEAGVSECECRISLIHMSGETFADGGHAIAWAMAQD